MRPRGRGSLGAVTAMSRAETGSRGPVKAVSVISTGTVRIRPEHPGGSRAPLIWCLLTSRRWTPPQPINVYVIEHARGLILFDTGQDRASVTDALALQQPALVVLPAHDPIAAQRLLAD